MTAIRKQECTDEPPVPQEWIDQSVAFLERLESQRDGLETALGDAEVRVDTLTARVQQSDQAIGQLERATNSFGAVEKSLSERRDQLDKRRQQLREALRQVQRERDAVLGAEADLAQDMATFEQCRHRIPEQLCEAVAQYEVLSRELTAGRQTRDELAAEVERIDGEMGQVIRALEVVVPDDTNESAESTKLTLVPPTPPPPDDQTVRKRPPPPPPRSVSRSTPATSTPPPIPAARASTTPATPAVSLRVVPTAAPAPGLGVPRANSSTKRSQAPGVPAQTITRQRPDGEQTKEPRSAVEAPAAGDDEPLEEAVEPRPRRGWLWLGGLTTTLVAAGVAVRLLGGPAVYDPVRPYAHQVQAWIAAGVAGTPMADWVPSSWAGTQAAPTAPLASSDEGSNDGAAVIAPSSDAIALEPVESSAPAEPASPVRDTTPEDVDAHTSESAAESSNSAGTRSRRRRRSRSSKPTSRKQRRQKLSWSRSSNNPLAGL
ncbi:MAG: hypothetical protein AAGF11_26775 [Myxococcota bacterium]